VPAEGWARWWRPLREHCVSMCTARACACALHVHVHCTRMRTHLVEVGAQLEQADRAARLGDRVEQHVAQHAQHRWPLDLQLGVHAKVRVRVRDRVRLRVR
jgi:hypothetical protein